MEYNMSRQPYLPTELSTKNNMNLPEGYSCKHCLYFMQCAKQFNMISNDKVCDFIPSRFSM